jgi:predicted dithiol-disulfide oxidoreductase (DUF899 family)
MFDPEWNKGCSSCSGFVDALGDLSGLNKRATTFVLVSRAPLEKLRAYQEQRGWDIPWYSSFGSDFNYDFHVTLDEKAEYNYRSVAEMKRLKVTNGTEGEEHALSVYFRLGNDVYHTYSTYGRGTELLTNAYAILDATPYGRQEDFEDSPEGWPQKPTGVAFVF